MNVVAFGVLGLIFLVTGIGGRLGYFKSIYLSISIPVIIPSAFKYVGIPISLGFIVMEIATSNLLPLAYRVTFFNLTGGPLFIAMIILAIWHRCGCSQNGYNIYAKRMATQ